MSDILIDKGMWPLAVVIIACFAIALLSKPIAGYIERLKITYGKEGLSVDGSTPSSQPELKSTEPGLNLPTPSDAKNLPRLESIKSFGVSPLVSQGEDAIRNDLRQLGVSLNTQEAADILIRQLSVTQVFHKNEKVYRLIFGSQIALLQHLNLFGETPRAKLSEFYRTAKEQFPNAYSSFPEERHIKFLESWRLIITPDGDKYSITLAGKEFLQWMTSEGIGAAKPF